jgi:hypothetical protein
MLPQLRFERIVLIMNVSGRHIVSKYRLIISLHVLWIITIVSIQCSQWNSFRNYLGLDIILWLHIIILLAQISALSIASNSLIILVHPCICFIRPSKE